ncbi:DUF6786 family protein [Rubritalea marina]|uniref:DUF6786 family protein n=1 Tax=Rubritalea marina TaxID=361055 RepID=UPI00037010D1|nr:DUF6786 family protein [Rubritalea marina]
MKNLSLTLIASAVSLLTAQAEQLERSFAEDLAFLKQHTDVVELCDGERRLAVVPMYQGRVMTSTHSTQSSASYGWLNYALIEGGFLSEAKRKGTLEDHLYAFGGEERFWMGPEGGQFSIFFKPGTPFEFAHWKTPASLDTLPFEVVSQSSSSIVFKHDAQLMNHRGTRFSVGIERKVELLDRAAVEQMMGAPVPAGAEYVGYASENVLKNSGEQAWTKDSGLLSIWILGMYKPTATTTVVVPYRAGDEAVLGPIVNDRYFGKVPAEHLRVTESAIYFKGDGTRRGKIGVSPERSKGLAGSYDAAGKVLTLVNYNVPEEHEGYVNSMWEHQEQPYVGDVIHSYNDGSAGPGLEPLGPFYELETSSPAAALQPGQSIRHIQRTVHFSGVESALDVIAQQALGVSLAEIEKALP